MSDHNFEKQIQQKLDELKIPPADTVWSSVEARIRKDKRRRRGIIILPILLLLIGAGFYFMLETRFSGVNEPGSKPSLTKASGQNNPATKNNTESANDKNSTLKQSQTPGDIATQEQSQDSLHNFTVPNRTKSTEATRPETEKIAERKPGNEGNQDLLKNERRSAPDAFRLERKSDRKTAGLSEKAPVNKGDHDRDKGEKIQETDSRILKEQLEAADRRTREEAEKEKLRQNEGIAVKDSQVVTSLNDKTAIQKTDSLVGDVSVKPADSVSTPIVPEEAKPVAKKIKQPKFEWGLTASLGVSNIVDGGLFEGGFFGGIIGTDKSLVADVSPNAMSNSGNTPQAIIYKPSSIKKGLSYSIGGFLEKNISKKFSLSAGLQYSYYSTQIDVGNRVDSTTFVQNAFGLSSVDHFYRAAPVQTTYKYTNRFHFLELPVLLQAQLNKSRRLPLFLNAGISASYLVSTNALHFDSRTGVYYKDNSLFNKLQANLTGGLSISLWNTSKMPVHIGPQFLYGLSNVMKEQVSTSKKLVYFGLNTKFFLTK